MIDVKELRIMKKYLLILSALFFISCKSNLDCGKPLTGNVGFMLHGGFLDQYDEGRVYISIVKVVNPKDWDYNEYFTGEGFSKDEKQEMKVLEADSCTLKNLYFKYIVKWQNTY